MKRYALLLVFATGCCSEPTALDMEYIEANRAYRDLALEVMLRNPGSMSEREAITLDSLAGAAKKYEQVVTEQKP